MKLSFDFVTAFKYLNLDKPEVWVFIAIIVVSIAGFYLLKRKKPQTTKNVTPESASVETEIPTAPPGKSPEKAYICLCGAGPFDLKSMRQHVMTAGKAEKGKHGWKTAAVEPIKAKSDIIIDKLQKFRVLVRRYPHFGGEPIIEFSRINKPLGNLFWAEPSLPESGQTYYVKENIDGTYEAYDPRHTPIIKQDTPQQAYFATHWDLAEGVWLLKTSMWEQISKLVVWAVLGAGIIYTLVQIGGK